MERAIRDLEPWQVPPDEAYWQALLQEGEYGEGSTLASVSPAAADLKTDPTALAEPIEPATIEQSEAPTPPLDVEQERSPAPAPQPSAQGPSGEAVLETAETPSGDPIPGEQDMATTDDSRPAEQPLSGEPGCWDTFAQHLADGELVDLTVEGYNRGGLLVRWMDVSGFVPASQLCAGLRYGDERSRMKDLAERVGCSLTLRVIEVDGAKNRLIFSERAARHIQDPNLAVLDELNPGDVCPGHVTNLCTFGAFVDLGGIEGLIHISELSWGRVAHPADMLQSGQQVEVYVLNVDREQGRVGLSLKRLQPDPWDSVDERYAIDQVLEGTITNIVNFGAFVRLAEGLEGLIHASELTGGTIPSLYSLHEGEQIVVRINSIESARHRIGLSLEHL